MSTITPTPSGIVETGMDNQVPAFEAQVKVGQDFQGNQPISTPTPALNIINIKMNRM